MKKLLKSENCGSREQCTGPTDVLKMTEKSKFSAIVHVQYLNSNLCLQLRVQKKKKKKENADAESKQAQIYYTCFQKLKMYLSLSQWFERRDKMKLIFIFFKDRRTFLWFKKNMMQFLPLKKKSYLWRILTLSS